MEVCSHIIEIKKFMDKSLVCDIQVQDISLVASGLNVQTNKWLHLEDWLELDAAIDKLLHPFRHSDILEGFENDNFHIGAIRVDCKKKKISRSHVKILGSDRVYLPIELEIKVSKVDTKALLDQITHFEEKLQCLSKNTTDSSKESVPLYEDSKEYDPTVNNVGLEKAPNDYVPYTASVKTTNVPSTKDISADVLSENEPYSPKPVVESSPDQISESPNEIPTYKPARIPHKHASTKNDIENNNGEEKTENLQSSRPRRKRSPFVDEVKSRTKTIASPSRNYGAKRRPSRKTKTMNDELFGSDNSDHEKSVESSDPATAVRVHEPLKHTATPIRTPSDDRLHKEIKRKRFKLGHEKNNHVPLDGWLTKGKIKPLDKTKDKFVKTSSRQPPSTNDVKTEVAIKTPEEQAKIELQLIEELVALNDKMRSKRKSPPPVMEMLNLTHLSTEDILKTFEDCKPKLDEIFKKFSKKSKVTGFDGINHMKTIMLIDDKKQLKMMNFLRENYQPEEKGVPSLTDLYINALVPEWTVNMFMKEFKFTRTEAIDRLQAQEESLVYHNTETLDTSGPL